MTTTAIRKLAAAGRCPCCGSDREEDRSFSSDVTGRAGFLCGAAWITSHGQIVVDTVCPAGSRLAAHLWNEELKGASREQQT